MQYTCDICNKNIFLIKHRLIDGTIICNNCENMIPIDLIDYATVRWRRNDLETYLEYKRYSDKELTPIFKETYHYGDLSIDENHALYKLNSNLVIYEARNINSISFSFEPESVKKSFIFKTYAIGKAKMHLESNLPVFKLSTILSSRARAEGYMENGVFVTRLPDPVIEIQAWFKSVFDEIQAQMDAEAKKEEYKEEEHYEYKEDKKRNTYPNTIQSAMALFMYDTLDGLKTSDIKSQRNKLLKAFHPDEGEADTGYAQKINTAYELLIKAVKEGARG